MDRRLFLAGATAALVPSRAGAAAVPPSGTVGLICTRAGIAGIVSDGEDGALLYGSFRWHIGSNTKAMTAALYARLVDRRRCRWRASVASLFPSVAAHPAWTTLYVEDLLSHAAGLTDRFVDAAWLGSRRADGASARDQRRALVARVLAAPPPERPGVYRYGNLNYVLVGSAIEEATGMDWEEAMRHELFAPLRIAEAGFGAPRGAGPWGRTVEAGTVKPIDPAGIADNPPILWPSGGVHLTPSAYAQFLAAFLRDGAPLVRTDTLGRLLTPARPDLRYAGGWSLDGPAGALADTLTHNGSNTFWFATATVDRRHGHGYAALTNRGGEAGEAATARLIRKLRLEHAPS